MSWRNEYLAALQARDRQEQAHKDLYDAYTKLADRTARLEATSAVGGALPVSKDESPARAGVRSSSIVQTASASKLKEDLVEAQKSRAELQSRLTAVTCELERLRLKSTAEEKRIHDLNLEKAGLSTKVRDRDEELRGKAKLLEDIHDETVALTLQLNIMEEQKGKLDAENKNLIDRWMARMGQEAEAMNVASKFS